MYKIETEKFSGPLDLLLNLIEQEKLDITEISLAKITDSFLAEIAKIQMPEGEMADFLIIASKLLYLKSKELLPSIEDSEKEEEILELETALKDYQKFRQAAEEFKKILAGDRRSFARKQKNDKTVYFLPPDNINHEALMKIFQSIIVETDKEPDVLDTEVKYTIEDKIIAIKNKIEKGKTSLSSLFTANSEKIEKIVTFIALLELIKKREVTVRQKSNFSDIIIVGVNK